MFPCEHENEPIIHLFLTCHVTHNPWDQLYAWPSHLEIKVPSPLGPEFLIPKLQKEKSPNPS